jgi:cytochrome c oxidase subunit IV
MSGRTEEASVSRRRSERHPLDVFSLLAGIVFVAVGMTFLVDESATSADADLGWVLAALLIGLGLAGALSSVVGPRRDATPAAPAVDTEVQETGDREEIDQ